jgi:hypothetical protein
MSPFIFAATTNPMQNPALSRHCLDVGRALKRVDRTTFLDWARWCEGVFSVNVAMVLWDSFAPVACDVHCASYSQVQLMLHINPTVAQALLSVLGKRRCFRDVLVVVVLWERA